MTVAERLGSDGKGLAGDSGHGARGGLDVASIRVAVGIVQNGEAQRGWSFPHPHPGSGNRQR